MLLTASLPRYISQQTRNVRRVQVLVLAPAQHRKRVQPVAVVVPLQTTKECFRSRSRAVHAVAMASLLKIRVPRVEELALNVGRVK